MSSGSSLINTPSVVDLLIDRIRSGEWAVGTQIPSERALSAELSLSRNTVREALAALQLAGYIQTRVGAGRYVIQHPDQESGGTRRLTTSRSIAETLAVREALELGCAYLAAKNATPEDRAVLAATVRELEALVERAAYGPYLAMTLTFHRQISAATGSAALQRMTDELIDRHKVDQWLLESQYDAAMARRSLCVHRQMAIAIINGDPLAAVTATGEHYEAYPALQPASAEDEPSTRPVEDEPSTRPVEDEPSTRPVDQEQGRKSNIDRSSGRAHR